MRESGHDARERDFGGRRGKPVWLGALALLLALGVACGGADDGDAAPPTATSTPTEAASTETAPATTSSAWPEVATGRIITEDLNVRTGPGTEHAVLGRLQPGDEVPVSGRAQDARWLALTGIGWVAYHEEWIELPGPVSELPEIPPDEAAFEIAGPLHPPGTATDIPVVDVVVEAVVSGDRDRLLLLTARPGAGDEAGEGNEDGNEDGNDDSAGAPASSCTDGVLPASALEDHIDDFFSSEVVGEAADLRLYAVVGEPGGEEVDPEFVAVLAFEGGEGRQLWIAPDGEGVRWFSLGCEPTPPGEMLRVREGEPFFWFRPVAPEPLRPVQ